MGLAAPIWRFCNNRRVPPPVVVPREGHRISRRDIDPDALRVLYRLQQHRFTAYLVGGGVRDLLLGRRPKDFDVGTDAQPQQIKRLFRNCWIIGRRFRLAHIKFGPKTIEVATFRKIVTEPVADAPEEPVVVASAAPDPDPPRDPGMMRADHGIMHRDNLFGTPEEDAFRRDFTINGLFYDAATRSVIDYVGGLDDLERRVIRSIGNPRVRFVEDPVRMFRAAVFAARLGFDMDADVIGAIAEHRRLITKASPARLMEEYFKVLRSGCAEDTFRALDRARLLELVTPELANAPEAVWDSLAKLDQYRQRFPSAPLELTTTILIGALLEPLGVLKRPAGLGPGRADPRGEKLDFGILPVPRRDLERLRQLLQTVPRLADLAVPPRVARNLTHRPSFGDSVTWLEIFGDAPDLVERWKHARSTREHRSASAEATARLPHDRGHGGGHGRHSPPQRHHEPRGIPEGGTPLGDQGGAGDAPPHRRRRRRRRRRGRGGGGAPAAH
jgi:poly(A) polymerase